MSGREVREYTNLSDPKDKKWGKGKDRIDDEDITFQRMVAKMQEVAGERGGYLHGRGALDSDDLLYLKEQMEAEEDAERLLRRTEKRAFAAFKRAASQVDSSPVTLSLPLRVEPKPKSGIRQQDVLKKVLEIRPKRQRVHDAKQSEQMPSIPTASSLTNGNIPSRATEITSASISSSKEELNKVISPVPPNKQTEEKTVRGLLGLAYESSDED